MAISVCDVIDCALPVSYVCDCQGLLICHSHYRDHLRTPGNHLVREIKRKLTDQKDERTQNSCENLRQVVQRSISQTLQQLTEAICDLVSGGCWKHADLLSLIQATLANLWTSSTSWSCVAGALDQVQRDVHLLMRRGCNQCDKALFDKVQVLCYETYRKTDVLKRVNCITRDVVLELNDMLEGLSPGQWIDEGMQVTDKIRCQAMDLFLKATQAKHYSRYEEAAALYQQCIHIQREQQLTRECVTTLWCLARTFEEMSDHPAAVKTYLEAISLEKQRPTPRLPSQFSVLLKNPIFLQGYVDLGEVLEVLEEIPGWIRLSDAYEAYITILFQHRKGQVLLMELACSAQAGEGIADLAQCESGASNILEVTDNFQSLPITPVDFEAGLYKFTDKALVCFLVAKRMTVELAQGTFNPASIFNSQPIRRNTLTCQFFIELTEHSKAIFTPLLVTIVLQSRCQTNIAQASANAITLLNEMEFSFVGKDFSQVKIPGADLCGADLSNASFRNSDMNSVLLSSCTMHRTQFGGARLCKADFGMVAETRMHSETVRALCLSGSGSFIASASCNGVVTIWKPHASQPLLSFQCQSGPKIFLEISPNDCLIAIQSGNGEVWVCELATGVRLPAFKNSSSPIRQARFSPNSAFIVCSLREQRLRLVEVTTGREVWTCGLSQQKVKCLSFSPDGTLIVSGGLSKVTIWDATTGQKMRSLNWMRADIINIAVSPNNELIACSEGRSVAFLNAVSGEKIFQTRNPTCPVVKIIFSSSSELVHIASKNASIRTWETTTWTLAFTSQVPSSAGPLLSFSHEPILVASCNKAGAISVWKADISSRNGSFHQIQSISCSPNKKLVVTSDDRGTVTVWETRAGTVLWEHCSDGVKTVRFSADSNFIASGSSECGITIWEVATGQLFHAMPTAYSVKRICFSADGTLFAAAGSNDVTVWKTTGGGTVCTLSGSVAEPLEIGFTDDNKQVFIVTKVRQLIYWKLKTGTRQTKLLASNRYKVICSSSDGGRIAISDTTSVAVCNIYTKQKVSAMTSTVGKVKIGKFTTDATHLVCGLSSRRIAIWEAVTGQLVRLLHVPQPPEPMSDVSPPSSTLVTASCGSSLFFWKLDSFINP